MKHNQAKKILSLYHNLTFVDKLHAYIRLRRPFFETAEKYVPRKGKILDFGCGHATFSQYLSLKSKDRQIIAVDISKRKISLARNSKHNQNIIFTYLQNSFSSLEPPQSYDCIISLNVLYLLNQNMQEKAIKKFHKALKKNGCLILTEQDASFTFKTFYTKLREWIMVNVFRLTKGKTLTINSHSWWMQTLKKYFKKTKIVKIDKKGFQKLYLCTK